MTFLRCAIVLFVIASSAVFASNWEKYVAPEGSFSFHYPSGWKVNANESLVQISEPGTDEEFIIIALPADEPSLRKSAKMILDELAKDNEGLTGSNYIEKSEGGAEHLIFQITYANGTKKYAGDVMVLKEAATCVWFSYSAPFATYDRERSLNFLALLISTVSSGSGSLPPEESPPTRIKQTKISQMDSSRMTSNANSFIFVIEFSLGAPFTYEQEKMILDEILKSWSIADEKQLTVYDQYPRLVQSIMSMNQSQIEAMRSELEKTTREWLDESDPSDKIVRLVKNQLQSKGKVLVNSENPLTEMAAHSYSELAVFSANVKEDMNAQLSRINPQEVAGLKKALKDSWSRLSSDDQKAIATTPGLWMVLRRAIEYGSSTEREKARELVAGALSEPSGGDKNASRSGSQSSSSGKATESNLSAELTKRYIQHQTMMEMNRMSFNTYMWSRGFNYSPATGMNW